MRVFSHLFKKVGMNVPSFLCETMRISLPSPSVCECNLAVLPLCENRKVKAGVRECVYSPLRVSVCLMMMMMMIRFFFTRYNDDDDDTMMIYFLDDHDDDGDDHAMMDDDYDDFVRFLFYQIQR